MSAMNTGTPRNKTAKTRAMADECKSTGASFESRIAEVRQQQRMEGHFDCFGKAESGFCDQEQCAYYPECIDVSRAVLS